MRIIILFFFVLSMYGVDITKATEERDKAVAAADAKYVKYLVGVVKKATDTEKVELYKLIAKYDPKNEEAAKFVAALTGEKSGVADLLGDEAIPVAKAKLIEKGYKSNQITDEIWKTFPGEEIKLDAKKLTSLNTKAEANTAYIVMPHPDDKWQLNDSDNPVTWKGIGNGFMQLIIRHTDSQGLKIDDFDIATSHLFTITKVGLLKAQPAAGGYMGLGLGSIRIKICKVVK